MPRSAPPRRPVPPAHRDRAAPVARRPVRGRDAPDRRPRLRRLPPRAVARVRPTDGEAPRQLTLGAKHDRQPRFSPDGRTLAFLSDRRAVVEEEPDRASQREGPRPPARTSDQVHLLPLDGGEARRLTDLPRGVDAFEWSPDGTRLVVVSASHGATRAEDDRRRGIDGRPNGRRHAAAVRLPVHRPARLHAQRRRASPTTGSSTCGWSTSRPARPRA